MSCIWYNEKNYRKELIKIENKLRIDEKGRKRILLAIIISILIEIFICNYPAFRSLLIGGYKKIDNYIIEENSIIISDINERVTSININYNRTLIDKITYSVKYTAEENSDVFVLNPKVILENQKQYINLDTHSKCKDIQIDLLTNSEISVENITINKSNFNISVVRLFILFIILILIIKIKDESIYKTEYDFDSKKQNDIFLLNLGVFFVFIMIYTILQFNSDSLLIKKEDIYKEDALTMQTESFINGKIALDYEPSKELKEM